MIYINTTGKQNQVWLPKPYDIVISDCPDAEDAYNSGYTSGKTDGYYDGWKPGYDSGYTDGLNNCSGGSCEGVWEEGYGSGYTDGQNSVDCSDYYESGYTEGYGSGFTDGAASVDCQVFYDSGRTDGWNAGYPSGYTDGLNACSGGNEDLIANLQGDYFIIPEGTTKLRDYAFYECRGISAITIPDSVTDIGMFAFSNTGIKNLVVPDSVTALSKSAFSTMLSLETVTLPTGITALPQACFSNSFYYDTSLTLPNHITSIDVNCFNNSKLKTVILPDNLTSIGKSCFYSSHIESIEIPTGITSLPDGCFQNCYSLSAITLPDTLVTIGPNSIAVCSGLTSIDIPSSVTTFGDSCFAFDVSLTAITIPENVTTIGKACFQRCSGLTEMTFLGTVPPVLAYTSGSNASLGDTRYTFPIYVPCEYVETYKTAFGPDYAPRIMCKTATGLSLNVSASIVGSGETTTTVDPQDADVDLEYTSSDQTKATIDSAGTITVLDDGDVTFCVADAITELQDCKTVAVSLPAPANTNLLEIKYLTTGANQTNWLFAGKAQETNSYFDQFYSAITKMTVDGVEVQKSTSNIHRSNPRTTDYYFYTFPSAGKHTVKYYMSKNYTPATQLDDLVFADNLHHLHIVEAKLGSGYQQIKMGVFQGAEELTAVTIPNTVRAIGPYSFEYSGIEELTIPDSVTALTYESWMTTGYGIFNKCTALTSASIGTGLTTLPGYTFDGCTGLKTVTMSRTTPPTLGNNCFRNCSSLEHIYVPSESVNAYKTASGWSNYASIISAKP